uniref:Uncharacterized protein n=1 Tax=Romanomermis culicivorax TaxID=13658 RepID=A0A915KSM3_ROMCU
MTFLGCPNLAPVSHSRASHFGARLTLAPVSLWHPSHFGACLTLAPYHSLLFGIHADHLFGNAAFSESPTAGIDHFRMNGMPLPLLLTQYYTGSYDAINLSKKSMNENFWRI